MNNEIHRTWWAGTHEKRDYPSKGDFSNFNFYKTKEKKKKKGGCGMAVGMGLA